MSKPKKNQPGIPVPKVACPRCGHKQPAKGGPPQDAEYFCPNCRMSHDGIGDEGGDFSDRDPSARLNRQERIAKQFNRRR